MLEALLDLCERELPEASVSMRVTQGDRYDVAESYEEALTLAAVDPAAMRRLAIHVSQDGRFVSVSWGGTRCDLAVHGPKEVEARALRDMCVTVLGAGVLQPEPEPEPAPGSPPPADAVARSKKVDLRTVRLALTYVELAELVRKIAAVVRGEADTHGDPDFLYIALTERRGGTVRIKSLAGLSALSDYDPGDFRFLSVSIQDGGPTVSLYFRRGASPRGAAGSVEGTDESRVLLLRAAVNDVLREHAGPLRWMPFLAAAVGGVVMSLVGVFIALFVNPTASWPFTGLGFALGIHTFVLPGLELLRPDQEPRIHRWARWLVGAGVAYGLGCAAIPIFSR